MSEMDNHRSVEWKKVSKIRLFLILASLVWLVFCLILIIMQKTNKMTILIHFFTFFIDKDLLIYSLFLLGTLWLMALLAFLWKKTRKKVAKGFLLLSNITLYERKNPFFIKEIEGAVILPDDGYLPISQEEYWVKWNKNVFTLAVDRGYADGSWAKMTVTLGEEEKVEEEVFYPNGRPSDHREDER